MSRVLNAALVVAAVAVGASAAQAQLVALYGEFHESNGIITNIPQNPPIVPCVPPPLLVAPAPHLTIMNNPALPQQHIAVRPTGLNDARCHARAQHRSLIHHVPNVFNQPRVGAKGARNVVQPAGVLDVGNPFTIPPFAFIQELGPQVGQVLRPPTREIDTTFIAAMPGADRNGPSPGPTLPATGGTPNGGQYTIKTVMQLAPIPALTRMFSQMNWQNPGNGWDNGLAPGGVGGRTAANQVVIDTVGSGINQERVQVRYTAGPRQFGGTMALLLDGKGRRYVVPGPTSDGGFPASWRPVAGTVPIGNDNPGFRRRNGIGWNVTIPTFQAPGRIKAFQGNLLTEMGLKPIVAPDCTISTDPLNLLPVGCNLINGFDTYVRGVAPLPPGGTLGPIPKAMSVKHAFGFTTGTVSIVVVANRWGLYYSTTLTGMGYDTVGVSALGGPQRNIGLVAGSYTARRPGNGTTWISPELLGVNLKFAPEPDATAALVSGVGALGLLGYRRRSLMRAPRTSPEPARAT